MQKHCLLVTAVLVSSGWLVGGLVRLWGMMVGGGQCARVSLGPLASRV